MPTLAPKVTARPALNLSLYLRDRRVLLVGTGAGADERLSRLDDAGATVERIDEEAWRSGEPPEGHFFLVIGHSADDPLNAEVAQWARDHATLAYAHDQPLYSDFAFPALAKRGPLRIAISTHGVAPALAAHLRREFEARLEASGKSLDAVLEELERVRRSFPRGPSRMQKLKEIAAKVRLVGEIAVKL
tara:strand:- start:121649 stop:122215 length:567 start_codon:yes stop_codon:yes gene_type:complete